MKEIFIHHDHGQQLSNAEQAELAARAQTGDLAAESRLITSNIGFIYNLCLPCIGRLPSSMHYDILIGGIAGFRRAIQKYKVDYGANLITYATYYIRAYAAREAKKTRELVHVPHTALKNESNRYHHAAHAVRVESIDVGPVEHDHIPAFEDLHPDPAQTLQLSHDAPIDHARLIAALNKLKPLIRRAVVYSFGLTGHRKISIREQAEREGVTYQAIQFRKEKGLRLLRELLEKE